MRFAILLLLIGTIILSACSLRYNPEEDYTYHNFTDLCQKNLYGDSEWIDCTTVRDCDNSCITRTCRSEGMEYHDDFGYRNSSGLYYCICTCRLKN